MAGLLHPLTPRGKKMWLGDEGMAASLELIQAAVDACPHRLVLSNRAGQRGIVRLVTKGEKQRKDYAKAATAFPHELSFVQLQAGVPGQGAGAEDKAGIEGVAGVAKDITEGLMVHEGLALKGASYTAALLEACHNLGDITWQIQNPPPSSLEALLEQVRTEDAGDVMAVVVAAGAASVLLPELQALPITPVRAQNIIYEQTSGVGRDKGSATDSLVLQMPVISGRYVVPFDRETFDHDPCDCNGRVSRYLVAGASQENDDGSGALWDAPANMSRALDLIEEELVSIYPPLNASGGSWAASHARAGIKGVPSRSVLGAIPLCGRVRMGGVLAEGGLKDKVWVFAGLGSRGLIHHAILGLALAQAILTGDEERIPAAARRIRLLGGAEE